MQSTTVHQFGVVAKTKQLVSFSFFGKKMKQAMDGNSASGSDSKWKKAS